MKKNFKITLLLLFDVFTIIFSFYLSLWIKFDGKIQIYYYDTLKNYIFVIVLVKIIVFVFFKLYKNLWRYATIDEFFSIGMAVIVSNAFCVTALLFLNVNFTHSVYILVAVFDLMFMTLGRFSYRLLHRLRELLSISSTKKPEVYINTLIVGAGHAGSFVIKEYKEHKELHRNIIGVLDDDVHKHNSRLNGAKVFGSVDEVQKIVNRYDVDEIIIAIPSAKRHQLQTIVDKCSETSAKIKTVPGLYQLVDGTININEIKEVQIEDLLGRAPVDLDKKSIEAFIENKRVLVTGGGGSIGSELCRQIANFNPKELLILDIYENNAYDLQQELIYKYNSDGETKLNFKVLIASVRDKKRINDIISEHKPDVVFHAAAHKHVPLMEDNPAEAVKNNILGTHNVARACHKLGVEKFVLISTDKAVNPTNVMGATKRFCENIIQAYSKVSKTEFVAVRFGNVLGSNGSVIPLFKKQIANGGPITVTDKNIIRYFMTIPEAAQLVLQAGAMATGGEIFVLDMGEPVKIYDLAVSLIKLSGLKVNQDIKIKITGLRPGEKLYEELLMAEEGLSDTVHEKIHIGKRQDVDYNELLYRIYSLEKAAQMNKADLIVDKLKYFVDTYKSNKDVNSTFLQKKKA